MKDSAVPDLTVKVTGSQWMWHYDYLHDNVAFYSHLMTPLAQIENSRTKGRALPARGGSAARRAREQQIRLLLVGDNEFLSMAFAWRSKSRRAGMHDGN